MTQPKFLLKKLLASAALSLVLAGGTLSLHAQTSDDGRQTTPAAHSPEKNKQEENQDELYRHSAAVRVIGKALGMSVEKASVTFEVANFLILAGVVGFFLLKTLPKTFRDRNSLIQKHLVDARIATEEAGARLRSVEERLSHLDEQIAAMRAQAEADSARDEARIKATVEEEKQKILLAADQEISAATVHAHRQLQQYAAELAIEQAARKLVVSAEMDRLLVQNFARSLGSDEPKGGQN